MKKVLSFIWEIFQVIIISLAIIIPIRYFLVQPFFVKGSSMEPNFQDGQYLIINEINYRFHHPERGEVIVFKYPLDNSQYYIKRIIGLPNEKIKIEDDKIIVFNDLFPQGMRLDESAYLPQNKLTSGSMEITLQEEEYFVLGDNRSASFDSRRWGPLSERDIIGRVWLRAWPVAQAAILSYPIY